MLRSTNDEPEALRLTLTRYVENLGDLINQIYEYDSTLIEYYKNNTVPFADGDRVDLQNRDTPQVIAAIAKRIYKTRNAIVHSKEGQKARYVPFQHDKLLAKELPLMRFIAEEIIVGSAQPIQ